MKEPSIIIVHYFAMQRQNPRHVLCTILRVRVNDHQKSLRNQRRPPSIKIVSALRCLEKSRRIPSTFWDLWRNWIFPFSREWFGEVGKFLGPNDTKYEINSSERANFSLSDGAKQNSVGSIVFELWFFESFFIFSHFCFFFKNEILS